MHFFYYSYNLEYSSEYHDVNLKETGDCMFAGSNVAIVTPFTNNLDAVDYDKLKELIEWHISAGTDGILPTGCTGEAATLSHKEQKEVIKFTVEVVAGRAKVIPGTGSNNTKEAIELSKYATEVGADGVLVITPYYNKPTPEGQFLHYKAVADAADIPVMLYNVPGRTGTKISAETIARLYNEVENIVCVKEACGSVDQVSEILEKCDIEVLSGDDMLTLPMASVGGKGVVSVVANIIPEDIKALCDACNSGDFAKAKELHYKTINLCRAMFFETNPIPVKTVLELMGKMEFGVRMPLCSISSGAKEKLVSAVKEFGLI